MKSSTKNNANVLIQSMEVPIIDLSLLSQNSYTKSLVIKKIHDVCKSLGMFHVVNHGISELVIKEALEVSQNFFNMPEMMKKEILEFHSGDISSPVGLATVQYKDEGSDPLQRDLLMLYANPFEDFVDLWPRNPADYREKMGRYTREVRKLAIQVFGAIMESLNLGATHLSENFRKGMHLIATNHYSPETESSITIGASPHTDYSVITILLQSSSGLEVMDRADGTWKAVPELKGSLQVFVGDHLEVLSNGVYKGISHRVLVPRTAKTRLSIGSFHNFEMDEIVEPEQKLIHKEGAKRYKGCSTRDLLKLVFSGQKGRPIEEILGLMEIIS